MARPNYGNMLFLAAVGGGLYWASKQPGGVKGVWGRFAPKLKNIQNADNPLEAVKDEFATPSPSLSSSAFSANSERIEPVSSYGASL